MARHTVDRAALLSARCNSPNSATSPTIFGREDRRAVAPLPLRPDATRGLGSTPAICLSRRPTVDIISAVDAAILVSTGKLIGSACPSMLPRLLLCTGVPLLFRSGSQLRPVISAYTCPSGLALWITISLWSP